VGEFIKDFTSQSGFCFLILYQPVFQMVAKATFHSIHGGFRKAAAMIAGPFFPLPAAVAADFSDRHVSRQPTAAPQNLRVAPRGNNRLYSTFFQRFINLALIIGSVAVKFGNVCLDLVQQGVRLVGVMATVFRNGFSHDFMRVRIDGQVQFPPSSPFCLAVLAHLPLAFAENLKSRAVNNHVDVTSVFPNVQQYTKLRRPLGQRRIIWNVKAYFHQCGQRFSQSFGLAIWQLKKFPQNQQALYRHIAVYKRVAHLGFGILVTPFLNCVLAKPERNRASINQRLVVFSPISVVPSSLHSRKTTQGVEPSCNRTTIS
jgi:hypothetical protein